VWIGTGLVAVMVVAAGGVLVVRKSTSRYGVCRNCGVKLVERVDLCQPCRHEAADALRRATAERADHARLQEDEQRRQAAREVEQQIALEEEARRQQLEEAQKEQARQEEERARRQSDDEARRQPQIDVSATQEFDPYAVLGLPQDASSADVDAAYKTVRSKFDLDLVADMGVELQEHMKRKAEAVERAYETLTALRSQ
jgi:sRNA-binding protein